MDSHPVCNLVAPAPVLLASSFCDVKVWCFVIVPRREVAINAISVSKGTAYWRSILGNPVAAGVSNILTVIDHDGNVHTYSIVNPCFHFRSLLVARCVRSRSSCGRLRSSIHPSFSV